MTSCPLCHGKGSVKVTQANGDETIVPCYVTCQILHDLDLLDVDEQIRQAKAEARQIVRDGLARFIPLCAEPECPEPASGSMAYCRPHLKQKREALGPPFADKQAVKPDEPYGVDDMHKGLPDKMFRLMVNRGVKSTLGLRFLALDLANLSVTGEGKFSQDLADPK